MSDTTISIPKVIHYLWLSDEKTPDVERCLATWRDHLDGYEIKEWNKSNFPYDEFIWTREAFSKKKWAFVTDFFRLWVLENYGGIYMDADIIVNDNFDKFLNQPLFIGTEATDQIAAHVIGAVKGHPFIHECLQYYENRHFIKPDGTNDMKPIPNIITKIFISQYKYDDVLVRFDGKPFVISDMAIYPDSYFTINTYDGNNVCVHCGLGSWRDDSTDSNPVLENVMGVYFVKRFFGYYIDDRFKGVQKFLFLMMPIGLLSFLIKYKSKIKNNSRVKTVVLNHK